MMRSQQAIMYSDPPAQCRAARALLGWTQRELAERSGVPWRTIADFERAETTPQLRTVSRLADAFQVAGVILMPENGEGLGVRLKKRHPLD